jgi:hypothetical protein
VAPWLRPPADGDAGGHVTRCAHTGSMWKPRARSPEPAARIPARSAQSAPLARSAGSGRVWLDVPFDEKDLAKPAGARWDPQARRWYAPRAGMDGLRRWAPLPLLLPGEDRSFGSGLFVDLVPASCWFTNVRTCVRPESWDRIRKAVYGRAGDRCEACGRPADKAAGLRMEAHERWDYDTAGGAQVLRRLICLCQGCHAVTHLGLASVRGEGEQAFRHLLAVTGMREREGTAHVDAAFALWEQRSAREWELDVSMLSGLGIRLAAPAADARSGIAAARLQEERRPR